MPYYVHFVLGYPEEYSKQLKKNLSAEKYTGPEDSPNRVFFFAPRPKLGVGFQTWISDIYTKFRNFLIEKSKSNEQIPASEIRGAHFHFFQKRDFEKELILTQFGVEGFISIDEEFCRDKIDRAPRKIVERGNVLAKVVAARAKSVEKILRAVKDQLLSASNKTPLLLPFENFGTAEMQALSKAIFSIDAEADINQEIKRTVNQFNHLNKKYKNPKDKFEKLVYRSKQKVYFTPPGRALHASAVAELINGHEENCWVRGTLRFGVPYHPKFHYDCDHADRKIFRSLKSCHQQSYELPRGRTYINIAPNDKLR